MPKITQPVARPEKRPIAASALALAEAQPLAAGDPAPRKDSKISMVDAAYERLKSAIMGNRLPPGFQASEPEIAELLGMSRTPVREALVRLQDKGLVRIIARRGIYVLPVSTDDMREIYQMLIALEPEAAAMVAQKGLTKSEKAALESATAAMENALRDDQLDAWAVADDRFHRVLLECNGNARLTNVVSTLFDQAHRARMVTLYLRPKPTQSTKEHRQILRAITAGDPDKTRAFFRAHRERAAEELLAVLARCRLERL